MFNLGAFIDVSTKNYQNCHAEPVSASENFHRLTDSETSSE